MSTTKLEALSCGTARTTLTEHGRPPCASGRSVTRDALADGYGVPVFLIKEREGKPASQIMAEMLADFGWSS